MFAATLELSISPGGTLCRVVKTAPGDCPERERPGVGSSRSVAVAARTLERHRAVRRFRGRGRGKAEPMASWTSALTCASSCWALVACGVIGGGQQPLPAGVPQPAVRVAAVEPDATVVEAIADGTVTFVEYELAVHRLVRCAERQGVSVEAIRHDDGAPTSAFTFRSPPDRVPPAADVYHDCRRRLLDDVELLFIGQRHDRPIEELSAEWSDFVACISHRGYDLADVLDASPGDAADGALDEC